MPRFAVQQHRASRLHFDLRLEVDGVARSWAVPRGPSLRTRDRRLAVPVDDHGLEHLSFEGRHAGADDAVIVWDAGQYEVQGERPAAAALAAGHLAVTLHGAKLRGGFALTRTGPRRWILTKMRDAFAEPERDVVAEQPRSVLTGRTLAEVDAGA